MTRQQQIARLRGLGVSYEEIAAEFGIPVRSVQRIEASEALKAKVRARRAAEPFSIPKPTERTARPLPERIGHGDYTCRAPEGCGEKIHKGSYCAMHWARFHIPRGAKAA